MQHVPEANGVEKGETPAGVEPNKEAVVLKEGVEAPKRDV